MSSAVGRFSDAPYAAQRVFSNDSDGGEAGTTTRDPDRDLDRRRRGACGWDDGGGVISDEETGGGEQKLLFLSDGAALQSLACRRSGEAERMERRGGVLGMVISTGGAKEACDNLSDS